MMLRTPMNGSEIQKEQPQHAGLFHMFFRRGHSNIGSQKPYWLVVSAPLKNMSSSVGMIIPPRLWWESHNPFHGSLNHQPVIQQCIFHHIHYISIYNQIITGNFITLNSCIFENCHISWGWVGWGQPENPLVLSCLFHWSMATLPSVISRISSAPRSGTCGTSIISPGLKGRHFTHRSHRKAMGFSHWKQAL